MKHLLFAIAMLLVTGCKKQHSNMVKTLQVTYYNYTTSTDIYTYDSQGRQATDVYSTGKDVLTYSDTTLVITSYNTGDSVTGTKTYRLNAQGLVESDPTNAIYYYNSAGEETEKISPGDTGFYTWANGDQIFGKVHSGTGIVTDSFFYLTTVDNRSFGDAVFGARPKHLQSWENGSTYTSQSYTFDEDGRVITALDNLGGSMVNTYNYTYY